MLGLGPGDRVFAFLGTIYSNSVEAYELFAFKGRNLFSSFRILS